MSADVPIRRKSGTPYAQRVIGPGPVGRIRRLRRSELPEDTVELARFLVGKVLVRDDDGDRTSGRIVETEAYPVGDAAGHAFIGMTAANRSLFLGKGHAYIYFVYGSSYMCNVAAEPRGVGAGVLLRALEPLEGMSVMQRRRGMTRLTELAKGPEADLIGKQQVARLGLPDGSERIYHQLRARACFWALGEQAAPAILGLQHLLDQQPEFAPSALAGIGAPALVALE